MVKVCDMCMDDFRLVPLFQDNHFCVKNVGAWAHLQQWLLRPCMQVGNKKVKPDNYNICRIENILSPSVTYLVLNVNVRVQLYQNNCQCIC